MRCPWPLATDEARHKTEPLLRAHKQAGKARKLNPFVAETTIQPCEEPDHECPQAVCACKS
eukprot:664252-Pelagomonas_calceolata.AAC.2